MDSQADERRFVKKGLCMVFGNRRKISRWQINHKAKVWLAGACVSAECFVKEISLKGFQGAFGFRLEPDTFQELKLILTPDCVLDVEVWVAWYRLIESKNVYGFYFSHISELDRVKIYSFIQQYYSRQIDASKNFEAGEGMNRSSDLLPDKRIFERFAMQFPVRYLHAGEKEERAGICLDMSAKGLGVMTNYALEVKTPLELWISVPDQGESLYSRGEVVWSKATGTNEYRAGINLERADLMGLSRLMRS